jgi:hypothetical protein
VLDFALMSVLVGSFALLITAHVAIVAGLVLRPQRWRAAIALLFPPIAPYWGMHERMHGRTIVWLLALSVYIVSRVLAGM